LINLIEIENSISHSQSGNESHESQNLVINNAVINPIHTNDIEEDTHNETCPIEVMDSVIKDEVLNLCMKPPESPPNNIFSMPEPNESNNIVEDEDDEDDDESKLVIAENDKIETDYHIDADSFDEERNSFNDQTDENPQTQLLTPFPPSIHQLSNTNSDFKHSYEITKETLLPKDIDDESTTSCNESIQSALIQNFQMYSDFEKHIIKTKAYLSYVGNDEEGDDDSTKSGFEFESNSKSPTNDSIENNELSTKLPINEVTISVEPQKYNCENKQLKIKSEKENSIILPELQCREEIVDEETLNNALVIEYHQKSDEYDVLKPSTSKSFFDSINQPGSSKDSFYDDTSNEAKNNFFSKADLVKKTLFDAPGTSRSDTFEDNILCNTSKDSLYDNNMLNTSKSSYYENSVTCTSKRFYSPDTDVNNELFCEETIPCSPSGTSEEQFDHEERKKAMAQALFEEREAASAMYSMNRSFRKPIITMAETEDETESNGVLDQRHLQFLAEISSRDIDTNINKSSINKSPELNPDLIDQQIVKPTEKLQTKRKTSIHEHSTSKRTKTSFPIIDNTVEKQTEIKTPMPLKDGKPLVSFTPDMDSAQRQALLLSRINDLRKEYILVKARIAVIDRRRKKIKKRKRELAKAANINQVKQLSLLSTVK